MERQATNRWRDPESAIREAVARCGMDGAAAAAELGQQSHSGKKVGLGRANCLSEGGGREGEG